MLYIGKLHVQRKPPGIQLHVSFSRQPVHTGSVGALSRCSTGRTSGEMGCRFSVIWLSIFFFEISIYFLYISFITRVFICFCLFLFVFVCFCVCVNMPHIDFFFFHLGLIIDKVRRELAELLF